MDNYQEAYELARFIKEAPKRTPVKVYLKGDLSSIDFTGVKVFGEGNSRILFGDYERVSEILREHESTIEDIEIEVDRRRSAIPLLDLTKVDARVEPGAIIRDHVEIGNRAVIMMGAIINIGAKIGEEAMIDMNAVIGSRGVIGRRVHIGAGAVIAGVLEPPGKQPVIIEDDVLIGANAVILEGVRVGTGSVVAAGSVVTKDVPPQTVVAGIPARVIKGKDELDENKAKVLEDLRG